jgi:hypothetical protein
MEFDRLKNGTFYRVEVPPGSYEISCDSDQFVFDILDVDLEEGQTLFIAPWFRPGVMAADWAPKIIRERLASKYLKDIQEVPAVRLK